MKQIKQDLSIGYFVVFLFLILTLAYISQMKTTYALTNDTVIISMNISALSEITVTPAALEWLNIVPTYEADYKSLSVQNTGSVNFTRLWSNINSFAVETTNPIGKGNPTLYAAGSFLVMKNETGEAGYRFVNRIEWNETQQPTYMTLNPADAVSWGYFRNFTDIYLWNFNDSATVGQCLNGSQMEFRIKSSAESLSSPNRDMTVGTIAATFEANTTEWSSWTFSSGPLQEYCVYIYRDCSRIMVAQWDYNQTLPACSARKYISRENFASGMIHTLNLTVLVPRGMPAGNTSNSILTIFAE